MFSPIEMANAIQQSLLSYQKSQEESSWNHAFNTPAHFQRELKTRYPNAQYIPISGAGLHCGPRSVLRLAGRPEVDPILVRKAVADAVSSGMFNAMFPGTDKKKFVANFCQPKEDGYYKSVSLLFMDIATTIMKLDNCSTTAYVNQEGKLVMMKETPSIRGIFAWVAVTILT